MDLLGYICKERRDQKKTYKASVRRTRSGKTPTLLLGWLRSSLVRLFSISKKSVHFAMHAPSARRGGKNIIHTADNTDRHDPIVGGFFLIDKHRHFCYKFNRKERMNFFKDFDMGEAVKQIDLYGACTIADFLHTDVHRKLLEELSHLKLIRQSETYGKYKTRQNFSSMSEFHPESAFAAVRQGLEKFLNDKFRECRPYPLSEPLIFTDAVVQTYEPSELGISPHRDGKSCVNLISLIVLEGQGEFCLTLDREGSHPIPLRNEPRDLLLMRGPGFFHSDVQPFHFVRNVRTRRTTFAFRHRKKIE